jgi:hypothetical protein
VQGNAWECARGCTSLRNTADSSVQVRDAAGVGDVPGGTQKGATATGNKERSRWGAAGRGGGAAGAAGGVRRAGGADSVVRRRASAVPFLRIGPATPGRRFLPVAGHPEMTQSGADYAE